MIGSWREPARQGTAGATVRTAPPVAADLPTPTDPLQHVAADSAVGSALDPAPDSAVDPAPNLDLDPALHAAAQLSDRPQPENVDEAPAPTSAHPPLAPAPPVGAYLNPVSPVPAGARPLVPAEPEVPLTRAGDGRIIGGVAAGVAAHLRVPVLWVRLAFCLLALRSGAGVVAYALLWVFGPQASVGSVATVTSPRERRQALGIAALGAALAVVGLAIGFGTTFGWIIGPLGLAAVGGGFIWREADDARRQRWRRSAVGVVGDGSGALWRVVGGITLVVGGLAVFALAQLNFGAAGGALLAVVLTLVGVAIIAIPWWVRLVRDLGAERRELVAQQERAEIAAHLHDSVLQTLALIQRQAGDSREVLRLSRSQERELRSWLYGPAGYATDPTGVDAPVAGTLATALTAMAGEVEDTYAVQITPVLVGDTPLNSAVNAVVAAAREALVNAAKHSGSAEISVYAEVEEQRTVTVFVRDRGVGFDTAHIGEDRRGLAESIRGRMVRHGGEALVTSTPGEGTEVELRMPITTEPELLEHGAEAVGQPG